MSSPGGSGHAASSAMAASGSGGAKSRAGPRAGTAGTASLAGTGAGTSRSGSAVAGPSNGRPSRNSEDGPAGTAGTSLESIEGICGAIRSIAESGDLAFQSKLIKDSLLPALHSLESNGTSAGVPGSMIFQSALQGNIDPLNVLMQHPAATGNGLGYLFILLARCQAENADPHQLMPYIEAFCSVADPAQLALVSRKVHVLALWIAHFCSSAPAAAMTPLVSLLARFQGEHTRYLTSLHPIVLLQALRSGTYAAAETLLIRFPCTDVDTKFFPVTYQDNLKYHLYGGTILAVLEHYPQAIEMLEAAVSAPAHQGAASLLQIDAYKRLLLCQLLHTGETSVLPKYTSSHLVQQFKQLYTRTYLDFAQSYESLDRTRLLSFATEHRTAFEADQNLGLVMRCVDAVVERSIIRLQDAYKTLELDEVVSLTGLMPAQAAASTTAPAENGETVQFTSMDSAKQFVLQMVDRLVRQRRLSARMVPARAGEDATKRYIEFLTLPASPQATSASLSRTLSLLNSTSHQLSYLDSKISASKDFLSKAYNQASRGGGSGLGGGPGGMGGFADLTGMNGEEDLMGEQGLDDWEA